MKKPNIKGSRNLNGCPSTCIRELTTFTQNWKVMAVGDPPNRWICTCSPNHRTSGSAGGNVPANLRNILNFIFATCPLFRGYFSGECNEKRKTLIDDFPDDGHECQEHVGGGAEGVPRVGAVPVAVHIANYEWLLVANTNYTGSDEST